MTSASRFGPQRYAPRSTQGVGGGVGASLYPSKLEMTLLGAALMIAMAGNAYGGAMAQFCNYVVPTMLVIALSLGSYSLVSRTAEAIWAPLFWARISLIAYFGVGSVVPFFVNDETLNLIENFYYFFPEDAAKNHLVNSVFAFVLLGGGAAICFQFDRFNRGRRTRTQLATCSVGTTAIGTALLVMGLILQYGFFLPSSLGYTQEKLPLVFAEMAHGSNIGLFLLTISFLKSRSPGIYVIIGIALIQFFTGLVLLNKSYALLPMIMIAVGYIYDRPSFSRMLLGLVACGGAYALIAPLVANARSILYDSYDPRQIIPIEARIDAVLAYASVGADDASLDPVQSGWARLSYINGATFAINEYDRGNAGNSLDNVLLVWVPRIIYPNKPTMTQGAIDFNVALTGSDLSASTPGIPAEGYWIGGWIGLLGVAILAAMVFSIWSIYSIMALQSQAWHLLFVILLGMRCGTRLDGLIITDIIGPVGYAVLGHFALQFLNSLAAKTFRPASPFAAA